MSRRKKRMKSAAQQTSKQETKAANNPSWAERILEHVESYPSIQVIGHTIMVFVICLTLIIIAFVYKEVQVAQIAADVKLSKAEARKQEAIAAQNPYAIAKMERKERSVTLNINAPGYTVGKNDAETEVNLQPVKVNGRRYDHSQRNLLTLAYHIGSKVGYPETIQSILLQETLAGKLGNRIGDTNLPTLRRSYGVMQVKARTARDVLQKNPNFRKKYFPGFKSAKAIRDEEIIIELIQNDIFNIKTAALYFAHQRKRAKKWSTAVVAYNQGPRALTMKNPKQHDYYRKIVKRLIKEVRPFNVRVGLAKPKE